MPAASLTRSTRSSGESEISPARGARQAERGQRLAQGASQGGQGRQALPLADGRPELAQKESLLNLLASSPRLQRQCACGAPSAGGGSCSACEGMASLQGLQRKALAIGAADDPLEREADLVAERVMRMEVTAEPSVEASRLVRPMASHSTNGAAVVGEAPASVHATLASPGQPLAPSERAFFEPRFGLDFSQVRVHTDGLADGSAREVGALAYTVGSTLVFRDGAFQPQTNAGRRLLAHELAHVAQQGQGLVSSGALQRQARGVAGSPTIPHITEVVVNQVTPQRVTATFSDGRIENDECSSGKGHCCFDAFSGVAEGGACTAARSINVGNNCTPIGSFTVSSKIPVTGGGVRWWTQFHNAKSVALHEYNPVDGTPLSHGCVRLNPTMAQTIYQGSRVGVTRVRVEGLAQPRCEHPALQAEWSGDFVSAGSTPPDGTTIDPLLGRLPTQAEINRERRHILNTRDEMRTALGVNDLGLDRELAAVRAGAPIVTRIPRCSPELTVEEQQVPAAQASGFLGAEANSRVAAFTAALRRASRPADAERVVRDAGRRMWLDATAAARTDSSGSDDRQIYWTRLGMTIALRHWNPSWVPNADVLRRLHTRLLTLFEQTSRGMTASAFDTDQPEMKRILISGFDPFGFPDPASDIRQSNLSGAAALALDGETLTRDGISGRVKAVVFPVRYIDFNAGVVENHLRPHLSGPLPPHLVMSISQNNTDQFEFEEFAGRRRSTDSFQDNLGMLSGGTPTAPLEPPGLASGAEFLAHTVPAGILGAMRGAVGRRGAITPETQVQELPPHAMAPRTLSEGPSSTPGLAVRGSGGSFLSNEIFYRNSLLRNQQGSTVPMIHLHAPRLAPDATEAQRNLLIGRIREILLAALPLV